MSQTRKDLEVSINTTEESSRTALLDSLDCGIRDCPVHLLRRVLDRLDWSLAQTQRGTERPGHLGGGRNASISRNQSSVHLD